MGGMIVKITEDPSDDRWACWSTTVDNFTFFGSREEMTALLVARKEDADLDARFIRASNTGTSSRLGDWAFTEEGEILGNVQGWDAEYDEDHVPFLPRTALPDLYERFILWQDDFDSPNEPEPTYLDLLIAKECE
jgi:hypothetical protein